MNRKLLATLSLLLMSILGPLAAFAQPKLKVTDAISYPSDTVIYPNTLYITYRIAVTNIGNNLLNGPCYVKFKYNTAQNEETKIGWIASNFEVGQTDTLIFNDTIGPLGTNRYKGGGNIIVIWPQADNPNVLVPDTTYFPIYIDDITGVTDPEILAQRVEIYPNPVSDVLKLRYLQSAHKIERIQVLGLDGRLMLQHDQAVQALDMTALPTGMYLLVFRFKDGAVGATRIVKEN